MTEPEDRLKEVLDCAESFLLGAASTPASADLLVEALRSLKEREPTDIRHFPLATHLPLLVFETLAADHRGAVPLAAATTLIFVGVDVLDDFMDGDAPSHWQGRPKPQVLLGAATLLSAAPQALIEELDAPPRIRSAIQGLLARGLLEMSAGQLTDVQLAGREAVTLVEVLDSVNAKSGAMLATFAEMAAALAGLGARARRPYAELGRVLGVASQLRSDCRDLFGTSVSRDLVNRSRTTPIVMRLEQLDPDERRSFLERLEFARKGGEPLERLRRELVDSQVLHEVSTLVELHCETAHQLVALEAASQPRSTALHELIEETSILGPTT